MYTIYVLIQKYRSELYKNGGMLPPYSKSRGAIAPLAPLLLPPGYLQL